jgi:hypothetical protein
MSCAGCNDLELPNTPEALALGKAFMMEVDSPEYAEEWAKKYANAKSLIVDDISMLRHILKKLKS